MRSKEAIQREVEEQLNEKCLKVFGDTYGYMVEDYLSSYLTDRKGAETLAQRHLLLNVVNQLDECDDLVDEIHGTIDD